MYTLLLSLASSKYHFGTKGSNTCGDDYPITDVTTCEKACKELNLQMDRNNFLEGKLCHKDHKGTCKQDGSNANAASNICTKGNLVKVF